MGMRRILATEVVFIFFPTLVGTNTTLVDFAFKAG